MSEEDVLAEPTELDGKAQPGIRLPDVDPELYTYGTPEGKPFGHSFTVVPGTKYDFAKELENNSMLSLITAYKIVGSVNPDASKTKKDVVSVSKSGLITAKSSGIALIMARQERTAV